MKWLITNQDTNETFEFDDQSKTIDVDKANQFAASKIAEASTEDNPNPVFSMQPIS